MLFLVGSGTGPEVMAPVRRAVRTISDADWSGVSWSYDFSLMRIFWSMLFGPLRDDVADDARTHRAAAFADREPQPLLHRDRRDQLHFHVHVVPRHHHLPPRGQRRHSRHVRGPEVELRPVAIEERRVPSPLFLRQHVHRALELRVRRDRLGRAHHHPALQVLLLHPPQQQPDVVPRDRLVHRLAEHLDTGHHRVPRLPQSHHLHLVPDLHLPPLHPSRPHRPASRDREHVLHRHQQRLVHLARRRRYVLVHRLHQRQDRLVRLRVLAAPVHRLLRRPPHDRNLVPRKLVLLQQVPHLQLHQVQQLRVVHHVALVHEHHDVRNPHLPRQQDVLPRLRHRSVRRRHHQPPSVQLRRAPDHVLHVVRVSRTVHVRVVPRRRLVLHVRRRDRDPALPLFRRVVDRSVVPHLNRRIVLRQHHRDRRRQRRLPVVHVTNRPHVHVRLRPLELLLGHEPTSVAAT